MKTIARLASVGALVLGIAGLVSVATLASSPSPIPRVASYLLPADLDGGHFHLAAAPQQSAVISADDAVAMAQTYAEGLAPNPKGVSVQAVLFTDRNRGIENPDGSITLSFVGVPAYIVRFTGVPQPIFGGLGTGSGPAAQELNVVLDATTGEYIEMFSFK